ncbi:LINE-1 retrotransposable element ORF2 protein [Symbiodinium microadriaticum]|uniref:LINE-1 retrotransposable element ORF2 protein n=1 Tax=Symbiodinium microadriaticum TaxID=2951 RepID=A0A1Q9CN89_SYMMI|nr:LINE-1 retrotransposable element ORF2 protein [Symbiodinium microadriaticum]
MQRQKIVKRSLQRVHRRILRTGGAWYKGKWYNQDTASALTNRLYQQQTPASGTPAPHDSRANSRAQVHSVTTHLPSQSPRHLQVYTWNVGGLGGGLYDEILYYIHRHPVDVLVIQETKWRFTSRWDTHQYFFVHSGSSAADFKQGGLLTIVAKRLVDPGTLRYVDPLPGRLLRVQFYRHSQPCDVLNFYQHTWKATDHIRRLRTQALDHLTRTIHMIPKRSLMIIGGDFNATCVHSAPHVGRCVMERSQLWATDQEDLQALILGLHLCALNTFQSQHPHHTYMWGTQQSQIDYLFVRCDMADGLSRQSYAMHDHPLGAWRGGARHFLVHAQIPTHWRPWSGHASPSVAPAVDRHAIADALSGKADPRIQAFRTDVQSALNPAPASISELHDTVHTLALKHFPKPVPVRGPRPWQDGTLQQYASRMWGHLRSLRKWAARKDAHSSLQALFQCWRHSTLHLRMHRDARQQGRELRKQRRLSLLSDADQAIRQGQSRQFYQLIDKLAPKGRFRKFQMCKGGDLLTPAEELEVMRKHFVQLFNHDRPGNSTLSSTSLAETADTSFQVCSHELQVYLDKLPARKAGAPSTAPGAVWRACSDLISPTLAGLLNQRWDHSPLTPPEPWVRATLSLLLKPHKSGSAPKDFRPIGLLDALGKASISMLMSKIRADLEAYIRTSPQFAYLTGRSTSDALRRVYVHNTAARAMRMPSTRDPHYKRAGGKPVTLQGALQVCLDLTSAFDFVPRHLIAEALQDAGITGAPAQLLLSWLHACSYDLYVEGKCAHIPTNRGVKQGCPASPLLFAAFMTLITRRLSSRLTPEWVAQYLTMFADDFHVGKCFYGYNELEPGDNYVLSFEHPWNQFLTQCLADPDPVAIAPAQDAPVDAARSILTTGRVLRADPTSCDTTRNTSHIVSVSGSVASSTLFFNMATGAHSSQAAEEVLGQLQSCFGGVLANKRSAEEPGQMPPDQGDRAQKTGRGAIALGGSGKGFQGKGGRRRPGGRQQGRATPSSDNRSYASGSTLDSEDAELLHLLAKAVVRHEDTLSVLRRSTGWVFWIRSGENSILPMLADLAKTWYGKANSQEIQPNRVSLRVALMWGIMTCLKDKLTGLTQDQQAFAIRNTWADTNGSWNYQKWDAHHQTLIVDTTRPPLSTPQALESLGALLQVLNGDTLTRFAATQEIRADAQGKITFNADISLRAPGSEALYQELVRLQGSALFQIIGVQFKPEGYNRPPLIRRIHQLAG